VDVASGADRPGSFNSAPGRLEFEVVGEAPDDLTRMKGPCEPVWDLAFSP
jgi:hypothetical protein